MSKNINTYYLGLAISMVLFHLLYPPYLAGTYSYIVFILGALILNLGYSFYAYLWKKEKSNVLKSFNKQDLSFVVFLSNTLAIASFFYFFYLHFAVFADALDHPEGKFTEEYIYQDTSFFITTEAYEAMNFWELSIIILTPLALIISIIYGFQYRKEIDSNRANGQ